MIFHDGPTVKRFKEIVPETVLRALTKTIIDACPPVVKRCRRLKYPPKMMATVIGGDRYNEIQRAIFHLQALRDAFPFLDILQERHQDSNTYYIAVELPEARIAVVKVDSHKSLPKVKQRLMSWPKQPSLFDKEISFHATLLYGFANDPAVVTFMHIRFLLADGTYLTEEGIDLLKLLRDSTTAVEIEPIAKHVVTTMRGRKKIRRHDEPETGS